MGYDVCMWDGDECVFIYGEKEDEEKKESWSSEVEGGGEDEFMAYQLEEEGDFGEEDVLERVGEERVCEDQESMGDCSVASELMEMSGTACFWNGFECITSFL